MRECYKYYAGTSFVKNVPSIGSNAMTDLLTTANAIDNKLLKMADIGIDFIATNVGQKPPDPKWRHLNPDRLLVRDEFMQIFVRLASSKYLKSKMYLTYTDALKALFKDGILEYMKKFDSNEFRVNKLYNESCDMIFKYYQKAVRQLYTNYSGKHSKPHEERFMCADEFIRLVTDSGITSDYFGAKEVGIIFNLSMMTQVDELTNDRHMKMTYDEFIEAISRIADKCNLLLISSSYFGIDMNAKDPILNRKQTLVPDASDRSIFDPNNIVAQAINKSLEDTITEKNSEDASMIQQTQSILDSLNNEETKAAVHPSSKCVVKIMLYSKHHHE